MLWYWSSARIYFGDETLSSHDNTCNAHLLLERLPLLKRKAVRLGDDGNNVHNLAELLHHDNVYRAKRMSSRVDEEETAVNARVLNVAVAHGRQLLT